MTNWNDYFATRSHRMQASEIRELLKLLDQPDIISFAGGIPDPKLFPTAEIAAVCQNILADPARAAAALQYAVSEGYLPLRQYLADHMATLGVPCSPDNIMITNGSQQALDFFGKLFINPGDAVLVTWPTYLGALQAFNAYEPHYDALPGLGSNRTPESYLAAPGKDAGGRAKPAFGYITPEFQNPTGDSLTLTERQALLAAMTAIDAPLIEDHAYEQLRYDGAAVQPLLALDIARVGSIEDSKVIFCGTFSKSIAPALRIGWVVAAQHVIHKLVLINQASDLHVSPFNQMIAYEIATQMLGPHTANLRRVYKERRDAMLAALDQYMPKSVSWTKPEGGMFIWLTLPESMDAAALMQRAVREKRVAFVPGSAFFPDRSGANTLRLSFSLNEPAVVEEGIKRLASLLT